MTLPTDSVKEFFDTLYVKHRKALRTVDASEIDTLFGIVCDAHHMEYDDHISSEVYHLSEDVSPSSEQNDIDSLLEELRHVYQLLQEKGMSVDDIRQALSSVQSLSRIKVNSDLCVCFLDYEKKTVRFSRLQYVLYRLFLNHPEGIYLKQLPDHICELREIYIQSLTRKGGNLNRARIDETLLNITDPTRHTVVEYMSHIRKIIVTTLGSDSLARHYYIRGTRNHTYKITLSREFVL